MKRLFFRPTLYLLVLAISVKTALSGEVVFAKEDSVPTPLKRSSNSSLDLKNGRLAFNTNNILISSAKQVAAAYTSIPGAIVNSYSSLGASVLDSISSFFNSFLALFKFPTPTSTTIKVTPTGATPPKKTNNTTIIDNISSSLPPPKNSSTNNSNTTIINNGVSETLLNQKLQALNDKLEAEIYTLKNLPPTAGVSNGTIGYAGPLGNLEIPSRYEIQSTINSSFGNDINNLNPIQVGYANSASGNYANAFGYKNSVTGIGNSASGYKNIVGGTAIFPGFSSLECFTFTNSTSSNTFYISGDQTADFALSDEFCRGQLNYGNNESTVQRQVTSVIGDVGGYTAFCLDHRFNSYSNQARITDGIHNAPIYLSPGSSCACIFHDNANIVATSTTYSFYNFNNSYQTDGIITVDSATYNGVNTVVNYHGSLGDYFGTEIGGYVQLHVAHPAAHTPVIKAAAFGFCNVAGGYSSSAIGGLNTVTGNYATALGYLNQATDLNATAIGYHNIGGYHSTAIGESNTVSGNYSTALGYLNLALADCSTILGHHNIGGYMGTVALGNDNYASSCFGIAVGNNNAVFGRCSAAFGSCLYTSDNCVTEIGIGGYKLQIGGYGLIYNACGNCTNLLSGGGSSVNNLNPIAVGYCNLACTRSGSGYFTCQATALGFCNTASSVYFSTAIGYGNIARCAHSIAIGGYNYVCDARSTASGYRNCINPGAYASAAFGNYNNVAGYDSAVFGLNVQTNDSNVVEVGIAGYKIQIDSHGGLYYVCGGSCTSLLGGGGSVNNLDPIEVGKINTVDSNSIFSSAIGYHNIVNSNSGSYNSCGSSAFGYRNVAGGYSSSAFGACNVACGDVSQAFGTANVIQECASGSSAFGFLNSVSAYNYDSTAVGFNNTVSSCYSSAFGSHIINSINHSVEIGPDNSNKLQISPDGVNFVTSGAGGFCVNGTPVGASVNNLDPIEVGNGNLSSGFAVSTLGYHNSVDSVNSTAVGYCNVATNSSFSTYMLAIGAKNTLNGRSVTASGYLNTVNDNYSQAFGLYNNVCCGSMGFGDGNTLSGLYSEAFGTSNTVSGPTGQAFGYQNTTSGPKGSAFGFCNTASGAYSAAFGFCNTSTGNSYVFGGYNSAGGANSVAVGTHNTVSGNYGTAIGLGNAACLNNYASAIGNGNFACGRASSAFGYNNTASGCYGAAFGKSSTAAGNYSAVFGNHSCSMGVRSSAFGNESKACGDCSSVGGYFNSVFGLQASAFGSVLTNCDNFSTRLGPIQSASVLISCTGNLAIRGSASTTDAIIDSSGAKLTAGGTWTNASDRNLKENFTDLNSDDILSKINQLNIQQWNYKVENADTTHIGPVAQDFYEKFHLGGSDKSISSIDPAGVALVGIQALSKKLDNQNASTTEAMKNLEIRVSSIESLTKLGGGVAVGDSIISALQSFGAEIVDGIAYLKNVFVEHLTVGSPTHPTGITVYDQQGKEGCLIVLDVNAGTTKITPGKCEDATSISLTSGNIITVDSNNNTVVVPDGGGSASSTNNDSASASSTPEVSPPSPISGTSTGNIIEPSPPAPVDSSSSTEAAPN